MQSLPISAMQCCACTDAVCRLGAAESMGMFPVMVTGWAYGRVSSQGREHGPGREKLFTRA